MKRCFIFIMLLVMSLSFVSCKSKEDEKVSAEDEKIITMVKEVEALSQDFFCIKMSYDDYIKKLQPYVVNGFEHYRYGYKDWKGMTLEQMKASLDEYYKKAGNVEKWEFLSYDISEVYTDKTGFMYVFTVDNGLLAGKSTLLYRKYSFTCDKGSWKITDMEDLNKAPKFFSEQVKFVEHVDL